MSKKLICLTLCVILTMCQIGICASVSAAVDGPAEFTLLQGLDIVCGLSYNEDMAYEPIKKSSFINFVMNIVAEEKFTDSYSRTALDGAEHLGFIVSAAAISESEFLIPEEAIKVVVCLLGYQPEAEEAGGYPGGYRTMAVRKGVLSGVSLSSRVTYAEAFHLLANLLEADHANYSRGENGEYLTMFNHLNVLSYYRRIYRVTGIVTSNSVSGLYGDATVKKGYVKIDDEMYLEGGSDAGSLLGHQVDAYIRDTRGDTDTIVYVNDRSVNDTLVIPGELVDNVDSGCRELTYYPNKDSARIRRVSIAADAAYLRNGVVCTDYTQADFISEQTELVLVDSDGNGRYDMVDLRSWETMIVASIAQSQMKIQNEYRFDLSIVTLELGLYEEENIRIYKNGEAADFSALGTGDVLSVHRTSRNEEGPITIYAENNAFTGIAEAYNGTDDTVVVGGVVYEFAAMYHTAREHGESLAGEVKVGNEYNFRLDRNGRIISVKSGKSGDLIYGYVTKTSQKANSFGQEVKLRFFGADGIWQTLLLADKVKINNGSALNCENVLNQADVAANIPGLIGVRLNEEGEIRAIETPIVYQSSADDDKFNTTQSFTATYRYNDSTWSNLYYMDGNTVVFVVPQDLDEDESVYSVGTTSSFTADASYTVTGYNRNEYYNLGMVVSQRNSTSIRKVGSRVYMVKEKGETLDEEGNVKPYFNLSASTYAGISFNVAEQSVFDAVEPGDLIRIHLNSKGEIDNYSLIYSPAQGPVKVLPNADSRNGDGTVLGILKKADPVDGRILVDTEQEMAFRISASAPMLMYDLERNVASIGRPEDLEPNDYVAIVMDHSAVNVMAVYKNMDLQ